MVRSFTLDPIDPAAVDRLLAHAGRGPSAGFSQGYGFLVLRDRADLDRFYQVLGDEAPAAAVRVAPLLVVPCANKEVYLDRYAEPDKGWPDRDESRWPVPYWYVDTGMAALLLLLTAVDEGLGALLFGIVPDRFPAFRSAFDVPSDWTPIGAVAVGHPSPDDRPSGSPLTRPRKERAELVHIGRW